MRKAFLACALLIAASAGAAIPSSEREALVAIYQSTNGAQWTDKTKWLSNESACTWAGVQCNETESNVIRLYLYDNNLKGTLPSSIRNLTKLQELHVYNNDLRGALTAEIGELSDLEVLYADRSQFTGAIPASWGALKKLKLLGLSGNELTGPLPAALGDMTALEEVNLSYNQITGALPDLSRLTNLIVLDIGVNQVSGPVPASLGSLSKLQRISAGGNLFQGSIPAALGSLASLTDLGLSYNQLTGGIPASFGQLRSLERLNLRNNLLSEPLPDALGDLPAIQFLDLAENDITGSIPVSLYGLDTLEELHLGDNKLMGTLSPQIAALNKLQVLALYYNQFAGPIPIEITTMTALRSLELHTNQLTGPLPSEISRLTNLTWLDVSHNQLSGPIPPTLGDLTKLTNLYLYENQFDGTIPSTLGRLTELIQLSVATNRLTGTIPDSLRSLTKLELFYASGNELTGAVPSWIGEWKLMGGLFLGYNKLSGPLPAGLSTLEKLGYLDLSVNQLTGPLPDFTKMGNLVYLNVPFNELSGPLPPSISALTKLDYAALGNNSFSGKIPAEIGAWTSVTYFDLAENDFDGPIPAEIAQLKKAYNISLYGNHLSGGLPKELGGLTTLEYLSVSFNALTGAIPAEIKNMTGLKDGGGLDLAYNGLFTNDASIREFVNRKSQEGGFEGTQTVMPTNVRLVDTTDRSATLAWNPIAYSYYGGGYQVIASTTPNGAPFVVATTNSKSLESITVRNLAPSTTYFFTVATVSHPISGQENLIVSDRTAPITGTTKARVEAPAEVVITEEPSGMVQIDGVEVESDQVTLTNFGDKETTITVSESDDDGFFTASPLQFSIAAGASQIVTLHSVAKPPGTYYGYVGFDGDGAPADGVGVVLLSSTRPSGTVVATPVVTRIERAGVPGSDEVGQAQFRNTGTARLTGIVVSDQAWVTVPAEPLTIEPGSVGTVNFTIVRSKRPSETEGGLVANLTLVYVAGTESLTYKDIESHDGTSVSTSKVTIVDVTKPPVTSGSIPALGSSELAFFIPGVSTSTGSHADVSIINASGASAINDLKLYFTSGSQTSVATMQPLGFAKTVSLPNVVSSVYGSASATGTLQIRSLQASSLTSEGKVTAVTSAGTFTGSIPVFRGDRSIAPNTVLYLTGLSAPGDVFIQETFGAAATVSVQFRDAAGNTLPSTNYPIAGYGLLQLTNVVPANAVTAIIRNMGTGLVTAYARLSDSNGDTWSVVDWSRFYRYTLQDAVRIPVVDGASASTGTRRRAVRANAISTSATTDVVLHNPGVVEARATMTLAGGASRIVTVAPGATAIVANAGAQASSPTDSILVTPTKGDLVVTARSKHAKGGSAIPVLPATAGIRLGQSQVFASLDDSTTVRTGYGLTESSGASVKVKVSIIIDETNPLTATITSRTFTLAAGQQVYLPELVRSFAGDQRDTLFGDLHNLTIEVSVTEGNGAVVPFVVVTDVASGDSNVIVQ